MHSETLKTALFWCAVLLHVINSVGIDGYVCTDVKVFLPMRITAYTISDSEED